MSSEPSDPPLPTTELNEEPETSTNLDVTGSKQEELETSTPTAETPQAEQLSSENEYGPYPPGTIVLAKLKSFPPWPAIVIPHELVPEAVNKSKPKHPSQPRSSKKKHTVEKTVRDSKVWCVRFLRDDTYMWGGSNDISLLTKDQIEKFLNGKKGKKVIKSAYEMALNPPDVEEFIIWGSNGKPIEIDNEADDEDFEVGDEDGEEDSGSVDGEDDDEDELSEDLEELKQTKKGKAKRARKSKSTKASPAKRQKSTATPKKTKGKPGRKAGSAKKKKVSTPEPEESEPETSSDEDWDVDNETEPPVAVNIPSSKELTDLLKKRTPLVKKARITLQDFFLESKEIEDDNKSIKQISSILDSLEKLPDVQLSLVKHFNLHKVLFDILKRPDLESQNKEIKNLRKRVAGLVSVWFDIIVEPTEYWSFEERIEMDEGENEVKQENGDGNQDHSVVDKTSTENGVKEEAGEPNQV